MSRENLKRFPSISFVWDHDDEQQHPMDTQYSTPKAQIKEEEEKPSIRKTTTTTTTARRNIIEFIDLVTPPKLLTSSTIENYIPCTIVPYNERRLSILRTYPMTLYGTSVNLLLANVPSDLLSAEQLIHRQSGKYPCPFTINNHDPTITSYMLKHYHQLFTPIFQRFKSSWGI